MWIASPTADLRLFCRRSYQTKCAAFWSATIEEEKRSETRDWARVVGGSAVASVAALAVWRRSRRVNGRAGAIDVVSLCIDLVNRSTVSVHNERRSGVFPRGVASLKTTTGDSRRPSSQWLRRVFLWLRPGAMAP